VTLLQRHPDAAQGPDRNEDPRGWQIATRGAPPSLTPTEGDAEPVDGDLALVLRGRSPPAANQRLMAAFAAQPASALRQERPAEQVAGTQPLAEANKMRTALLAAVSHDPRTALSSAKAAVGGLRSHDVEVTKADRELLATADESLDRRARLVDNAAEAAERAILQRLHRRQPARENETS
jgi:two-component system, OmpR family, sensor histidine kinase KdpD